jgi:hypothetical protein
MVLGAGINHTMTDDGDIEGFRFSCAQHETAKCLLINRKMFFRTSMIECTTNDLRYIKILMHAFWYNVVNNVFL